MNAEMKHARVELCLQTKQGVDVTALRKRVSWLERRIEKVLSGQTQQASTAHSRQVLYPLYSQSHYLGEYQGNTKAKMADEVARIVDFQHFLRILCQFTSY